MVARRLRAHGAHGGSGAQHSHSRAARLALLCQSPVKAESSSRLTVSAFDKQLMWGSDGAEGLCWERRGSLGGFRVMWVSGTSGGRGFK
ncbi:hypothetical protein DNTS_028336 [Danionella cerebrum]|uniref:Uncharacterized protein n=1 Tax=Danionella cerebrum TaxID=2873325 RepID=A0A553RAC5_9TELE|nr:hypothetical protein DNTS_028336 [Danionella translucida]